MLKLTIGKRIKYAIVGSAVLLSSITASFMMPFTKTSAAADANYARLLQYSLYFYDANMCGTGVNDKCALDWRHNCHTEDASMSTPYGTMDLSGGFHDAGDHVKFNLPQCYSFVTLGWGFYEFKDAYTSTGQAAHAQTILNYFADYIRKCTVWDGSGNNVQAYCYQVGDGDEDHSYWGSPETQTPKRTKALFATSSNPGTDQVAIAAAALACNYVNFKNEEDLKTAKALYEFAQRNNKQVASQGIGSFYVSTKWQDKLALAGMWLYKATGNSSYKSDADSLASSANYSNYTDWPMDWDGVWPQVNAMRGDWAAVGSSGNLKKVNTGSSNYLFVSEWGSARYNASIQMLALVYDKYNSGNYASWADGQMKYLLGNNPQNKCYVVGFSDNSVKFPHHRAASGLTNIGKNDTTPHKNVLVGALVGGPLDANGTHYDVTDDYVGNEVALDYNAGFVGAAAGLCAKYGSGQQVADVSTIPGVKNTTPIVTTTTSAETTTSNVTTTSSGETTTITETQPTTTTSVTTTEPPVNPVKPVGIILYRDKTDADKVARIPLAGLFNQGDTVKQIEFELSASGNIGTFVGGYGFSTFDGAPLGTSYWYGNYGSDGVNPINQSMGSSGTLIITLSADEAASISAAGDFEIGMWWSDQSEVTVVSMKVVSEQAQVTTTATTTTTTGSVETTTTPDTTTYTTYSETTTTSWSETTTAPWSGTTTTSASGITTTTTATTTVPTSVTTTSTMPVPTKKGDVNMDGELDLSDVLLLCKYVVDAVTLSPQQLSNADVHIDGIVDVSDALKILRYLTEFITTLD